MIELFPDIAPQHVANFDSLVSIGFYDGTAFHRVVPGFVIQGGDPNSRSGPDSTWGYGDPAQQRVPAEFSRVSHQRGILSAARAQDPNSATSQFFICVAPAISLDGRYSVYGKVLQGMNIVDSIVTSPVLPGTERPREKIAMTIARTGIDTTAPAAPDLVSPADDTTRIGASQSIRWTPVDGAILYEVQLSTDPGFSTLAFKDSVVVTNLLLNNLTPGLATYSWRVRASNGGVRGPWSPVWNFTTAMVAPRLLSPASGATGVAIPAPLVWGGVAGATSYRLEVATSLAFTTVILDQPSLVDTTYLLQGLEAATRYYWRVTASDGRNVSFPSVRSNFTTATSAAISKEASPPGAVFSEIETIDGAEALIRFSLSRPQQVRMTIVDVDGRESTTLLSGMADAGYHVHRIDTRSLHSGIYYCRLQTDDVVQTRKLIIVR